MQISLNYFKENFHKTIKFHHKNHRTAIINFLLIFYWLNFTENENSLKFSHRLIISIIFLLSFWWKLQNLLNQLQNQQENLKTFPFTLQGAKKIYFHNQLSAYDIFHMHTKRKFLLCGRKPIDLDKLSHGAKEKFLVIILTLY